MTSIRESIESIALDIEAQSNKKNINEITKLHSDIDAKIENAKSKMQKLKKKYDENEKNKTVQEMSETEYEKAISKLANSDIDKILYSNDLEHLVDECMKLESKIESCKHYLKNKKIDWASIHNQAFFLLFGSFTLSDSPSVSVSRSVCFFFFGLEFSTSESRFVCLSHSTRTIFLFLR